MLAPGFEQRFPGDDPGAAYIFFGPITRLPAVVDLAVYPADVMIVGADGASTNPAGSGGDRLGRRGSGAVGDVLGDWMEDLVVSAEMASGPGNTRPGAGEVTSSVVARCGPRPSTWPLPAPPTSWSTGLGWRPHRTAVGRRLRCGRQGRLSRRRAGEEHRLRDSRIAPALGVRDLLTQPGDGVVSGPEPASYRYRDLASADVNGDGIVDLLIAATDDTPWNRINAGAVHVIDGCSIFGVTRDLGVDPADLAVYGADAGDYLGSTLSTGDVDGDGKADIWAYRSMSLGNARPNGGEAHIILGRDFDPGCSVSADAGPLQTICAPGTVTLDGSATTVPGCAAAPEYRWLRGASLIRDWDPSPSTSATVNGSEDFVLLVRCGTCAQACTGSASVHVELTTDTVPGDQGNVVRTVKSGQDVRLEFPGTPARTWRVFKDGDKVLVGSTALAPDAGVDFFVDPAAVADPPVTAYYALKGLSPCSGTPGP